MVSYSCRAMILGGIALGCLLLPGRGQGKHPSSPEYPPLPEHEQLDLRLSSPRDSQISYIPAEPFPFVPPYTGEEMRLRAMEFPHSPLWNGLVIDVRAILMPTGVLHQEVRIVATLYLPEQGFPGPLYQTSPGQELFRWLSYERTVELSSKLAARITAQEREGRLVFW
jgi:hypothetical protein